MAEHEAKKFAEKGAAMARDTFERGRQAAEQSAQGVEQSYMASVDSMRDFQLKLIDMAQANAETMFHFARQIASARGPSELMESWTTHARKQFETLSAQTTDLAALGQKMASTSATPIMRSAQQAAKKAS